MRRWFRTAIRDRKGAAAVEFSLLLTPFLLVIFGILDTALVFFVDGALDSSLHMAAREVRTGTATKEKWDLSRFKSEVCNGMALAFSCESDLLVSTTVMNDFSGVTLKSAVSGGVVTLKEGFSGGAPGDYVLVQAFLPWPSLLATLGVSTAHLADGRYVLGASALFRNEPFGN